MNRLAPKSRLRTDAVLATEDDAVARFARGDIGRRQAMHALGIGYGELLDRLSERGLPLPELPAADVDRMASDVVRLLDHAG